MVGDGDDFDGADCDDSCDPHSVVDHSSNVMIVVLLMMVLIVMVLILIMMVL